MKWNRNSQRKHLANRMKPMTNFTFHCNACGREVKINAAGYGSYGKEWRCCDKECYDEIYHRYCASLVGEDYIPWTHKRKDDDKTT